MREGPQELLESTKHQKGPAWNRVWFCALNVRRQLLLRLKAPLPPRVIGLRPLPMEGARRQAPGPSKATPSTVLR